MHLHVHVVAVFVMCMYMHMIYIYIYVYVYLHMHVCVYVHPHANGHVHVGLLQTLWVLRLGSPFRVLAFTILVAFLHSLGWDVQGGVGQDGRKRAHSLRNRVSAF